MKLTQLSGQIDLRNSTDIEAPGWFFHGFAPLTLEPWLIQENKRTKTLLLGNSGFQIELEDGKDMLVHHYLPNVGVENREFAFNFSSLYILALKSFVEWWDNLPSDDEFKKFNIITGSTNETMFTFRKKSLDLLGDNLIEGYNDTYDGEVIYHMDLNKLVKAFRNISNTVIIRLLQKAGPLVGKLDMKNPLIYLIREGTFPKE